MKASTMSKHLKLVASGSTNALISLEFNNQDIHDILNEECVYFQELAGQDTWSFSDGSYLTRNEDEYFIGDDIGEFEVTAS